MEKIERLMEMQEYFECRSGVRAFVLNNDKLVIVYDDHRNILNVMFYLYKHKIINRDCPPDIISFDYHDDGFESTTLDNFEHYIGKPFDKWTRHDMQVFVEFGISEIDNDWVKTAMEFDFIRNYVNVGGVIINNVKDKIPYTTSRSKTIHQLTSIDHLDFELSVQGCFNTMSPSFDPVACSAFNYNPQLRAFNESRRPVLLDFDLDCFTGSVTRNLELATPWTEKMFKSMFRGIYDNGVYTFMQELIWDSIVITICTEPFHCGGYKESAMLLGYLNDYVFDGKIDI